MHKMISKSHGRHIQTSDLHAIFGDLINTNLFDVKSSHLQTATTGLKQFSEVISRYYIAALTWQDARDQINEAVVQLTDPHKVKDKGDPLADRERKSLIGKIIDASLGIFDLISLLATTSKIDFYLAYSSRLHN